MLGGSSSAHPDIDLQVFLERHRRFFKVGWTKTPCVIAKTIALLGQAHDVAVEFPIAVFVVEQLHGVATRGKIVDRESHLIAIDPIAGRHDGARVRGIVLGAVEKHPP